MAKINPCFKKIFVLFNVLFAVLGIVVLALGILVHVFVNEIDNKSTALVVLYIIGAVTFIVSVLGAYGAQKENKYVLVTFFTAMCCGAFFLFRVAVPLAVSRSQFLLTVSNELNTLKPLNKANEDVQNALQVIQKEMKCCGLFSGYEDWGTTVPDSCNCASAYDEPDQCEPVNSDPAFLGMFRDRRDRNVYKKPCGPVMMEYLNKIMAVGLGVLLGLAALALLGAVMSLAMIIRISSSAPNPAPSFALNYQPPKYSELEECIK